MPKRWRCTPPNYSVAWAKGNAVIVGHSSNNLFNPGKYKYAFVMLNKLQAGDTFMLNYSGQRYVRAKVYQTQIVKPSDTWVPRSTARQRFVYTDNLRSLQAPT